MGCSSRDGGTRARARDERWTGSWARLIRAIIIVRIQDSAVIKPFVGAGRADEDTFTGKVDAERRSPGINEFALGIEVLLAADENDEALGIVAEQGSGNLGIVSNRIRTNTFLVLLERVKQVVDVLIELRGAGIDLEGVPGLEGPSRRHQHGDASNEQQ